MSNEKNDRKVFGVSGKPFCKATRVYKKDMSFDHADMAQGSFMALDDKAGVQVSFNLYKTAAHPTPFVGERFDAAKMTQKIPSDSAARLSSRGYSEVTDKALWPAQIEQVAVEAEVEEEVGA